MPDEERLARIWASVRPKRKSKLSRPPHLEVVGGAVYFFVQAGHRETAINAAIDVIRNVHAEECKGISSDPLMLALHVSMADWVVESLLQGAWIS